MAKPAGEATVEHHHSRGTIWKTGELVAGYEAVPAFSPRLPRQGRYSVLLCVKERKIGPRGGITPAESVSITGPSWASVCRAIQALGFTRPRLTATQVRTGT